MIFSDIWSDNKLGILNDASQVRLKPNLDDSYAWERMEENKHLLTINLSNLLIGHFKELCENVDKSFVTVRRPFVQCELVTENEQKTVSCFFFKQTNFWLIFCNKSFDFSKHEISFITKINELNQRHNELTCQLRERENEAITKVQKRQIIECEIGRLETLVLQLHMNNEKLQNHVQEWKTIVEKSQSDKIKHCEEMQKIVTTLIEIKTELTSTCY